MNAADGSNQHDISNNAASSDSRPDWGTHQGWTPPPADTKPPDVRIIKAVDRRGVEVPEGSTTLSKYIKITFYTDDDRSGVVKTECKLDTRALTSCTSPVVYDQLKRGTHDLLVRATDAAGNVGEVLFSWTVK